MEVEKIYGSLIRMAATAAASAVCRHRRRCGGIPPLPLSSSLLVLPRFFAIHLPDQTRRARHSSQLRRRSAASPATEEGRREKDHEHGGGGGEGEGGEGRGGTAEDSVGVAAAARGRMARA